MEQLRLPSGMQPDNVLWNEESHDAVVVEMKDVLELTEAHVRKVREYMDEVEDTVDVTAVKGFVPIAWDTEVRTRVRRHARRLGITIRRLG